MGYEHFTHFQHEQRQAYYFGYAWAELKKEIDRSTQDGRENVETHEK